PDRSAWHLEQADAAERNARWPAAIFHLGRALSSRPDQPDLHARRGVCYAGLGLWSEAEHDFRRTLELNPNDLMTAFEEAAVLLLVGRNEEFARLRADLLERSTTLKDPGAGYLVARPCALAAVPDDERARVIELAEWAVAAERLPWYLHGLGMAYLR